MDLNRKKNDVAGGPGFHGRSTSKMSSEVEKQLRKVDTEAGLLLIHCYSDSPELCAKS